MGDNILGIKMYIIVLTAGECRWSFWLGVLGIDYNNHYKKKKKKKKVIKKNT